MALTPYKEPNVYTATKRITPTVPKTPVDMYPLVIGTGSETIQRNNVPFTISYKGDNPEPITFEEAVSSISSVQVVDEWGDVTTVGADLYELTTKNGITTLNWKTTEEGTTTEETVLGGATTVYVSYVANAPEERFTLQRFTDAEDILDFYGAEDKLNKICVGARLAKLAGSPVVYVLQIEKPTAQEIATAGSEDKALLTAYRDALEEYIVDKAGQPIWRICPVDAGVSKAIKKFVLDMSEPEERAEKFATLNCSEAEACADFDSLLSTFKTFCQKNIMYRGQVFYPNKAEYTCDDGSVIDVSGELIGCAYAGFEQTLERKAQSATNSSIPAGLLNLKGIKMKRRQKNELAALGVTLLTQDEEYGAINVRDALSLDRSTDQVEDPCITMATDYYAKTLRSELSPYIGKYNITVETIEKVRAATSTVSETMIQKGEIKSSTIKSLEQDPDNLKSLIMVIGCGVLYPLKQINITLVLE